MIRVLFNQPNFCRLAGAAMPLNFLDTPWVAAAQENILQSQQMSFHPSTPIQRSIAFQ
jgi:hypothetical protein